MTKSSCKIGVITDSHIGLPDKGWSQPVWLEREQVLFSRLKEWIVANKVDFIAHCGDIAEFHSIDQGAKILGALGCPVLATRGNHDVVFDRSYSQWTLGTLDYPHIHFGDSVYENEHCDVVLLNNQWIDREGQPQWRWTASPVGWVSDEQIEWLDSVLSANPERPAIIVVHYPMHIEPLFSMQQMFREFHDQYSKRLDDVFDRHPRVKVVASGHFHCTADETVSGRVHLTTAAFNEAPFQVRLIEVTKARVSVETHELLHDSDPVMISLARSHLFGPAFPIEIPLTGNPVKHDLPPN